MKELFFAIDLPSTIYYLPFNMPSIQILSDTLINKIAAGEVVERPASVVKELLDNALDAKATQIDIEISQGGKKLIVVRDNGIGIPPNELALAIQRHSTSKIKEIEDLFNIQTLGFRGEALASMASVSQFTLKSRTKDHPAHEICLDGGKITSEGETGHPQGTTVRVQNLFYQTPARLKFLKSNDTELSYIVDYITKAALAHPNVAFKLTEDGKKQLLTSGSSELKTCVLEIFGREPATSCYEISGGMEGLEVFGLVGHPQVSRSHNRNMYFFVNGRPVKDKVLHHAVMEGFRNLLMHGRYPFIILFLHVPYQMVDVNVHPAKTEVRFSNSTLIHRAVYETVRKTLEEAPWMKEGGPVVIQESHSRPEQSWQSMPSTLTGGGNLENGSPIKTSGMTSYGSPPTQKQISFGKTPFAELTVLGQLLGTYIVCQAQQKLVLIDQHAAHERIGYEKLLLQHQKGEIVFQPLLVTQNFDLNPSETEILKKYLDELNSFGLEIDFFGGNTFVLRSIPVLLQNRKLSIKDFVLDLIGDLLEKGKLTSLQDKMGEVLAGIACHSAIRAHDFLNLDEMRALLKELDEYHFTSFCPHGRPVFVEVGEYEIEKWFKRVV